MSSFTKSITTEAYKLVFWQFIIVLGLALVLFILNGVQSGVSTLLGGLAYCLPNFLFVWRVFARASVRAVQAFAVAFFLGEATKLFLGAVLFIFIIKYLPVKMAFVLTGYVTAIFAFWVVSFIFMSRAAGVEK